MKFSVLSKRRWNARKRQHGLKGNTCLMVKAILEGIGKYESITW